MDDIRFIKPWWKVEGAWTRWYAGEIHLHDRVAYILLSMRRHHQKLPSYTLLLPRFPS